MRNLPISSLETVCWIARLGSFTAAAERLFTTQPGISTRVRELESTLGMKLFHRQGRGVELTVEGREFVRRIEPLLLQLEEVATSIADPGLAVGSVRIGVGAITMRWFPAVLREMRQRMPKVTFEIEVDLAGKLLEWLHARKLDMVVVAGPVDDQKFDMTSLGHDQMLWVASKAVVAATRSLSITDMLEQVPVWCVPRGSFYSSTAVEKLLAHGLSTDRINVISHMPGQLEIVRQGAGIGLLSKALIREDLDSGALVALPDAIQPFEPVPNWLVTTKGEQSGILLTIADVIATHRASA
ncbi:LysR family transcriptional regulator [soil metagenome]